METKQLPSGNSRPPLRWEVCLQSQMDVPICFDSISFCSVQGWLEVEWRTWRSGCWGPLPRYVPPAQLRALFLLLLRFALTSWSLKDCGVGQKDLGRWLGSNLLLWQKKEKRFAGHKNAPFLPPPPSNQERAVEVLASEPLRPGSAWVSTVRDWQHKLKLNTHRPRSPLLPWFVEKTPKT